MKTTICLAIMGIALGATAAATRPPSLPDAFANRDIAKRLGGLEDRVRRLEDQTVTHLHLDLRLQAIERRLRDSERMSGAEIVGFARLLAELMIERDLARGASPDPNRPGRLYLMLDEARRNRNNDPNQPNRFSGLLREIRSPEPNAASTRRQ